MNRPVLPLPALDRGTGRPIAAQLAGHLRGVILRGELGPGARLASSRALADALGIARATVTTAYEQLAAEGYVSARQGSSVRVARGLHAGMVPPRGDARSPAFAATSRSAQPFATGAVDASMFPRLAWSRALARAWRDPRPLLGRIDPFGAPILREAIAAHLAQWRGLGVGAERIVVTSGAVESITLLARALLKPGDRVAVEDPGYLPIRDALSDAGLAAVPVRVDAQGFDPERLLAHARVRAVLVTPSRQFPMGPAMPVARRLALLAWAARTGALVIEDDFDSEYRYRGAPLPALASLDAAGRTIYLGSFSKVLSGALRIGWMALPDAALAPMRALLARTGTHASLVPQPALAELIATGRLARHIRRTRRVFAARQAALLAAADRHFAGLLDVQADPSGMHLVARLAPQLARRMTDREAAGRAEAAGITAAPISAHSSLRAPPQGLLLGFAGFAPPVLEDAAQHLARALRAR
jgi:GntR family transcriptional regulator/MocR family aminotransferase